MNQVSHSEFDTNDPRPISDFAYELIVDKIIRLEIEPGSAIAERALMEEFGIGRTPIREALQRLTHEGLVCREHYRGVYVCEVTPKRIAGVAEFCKLFDRAIARCAVERATAEQGEQLQAYCERMREEIDADNLGAFSRMRRRFWDLLVAAADNLHFEDSHKSIYNFRARIFYMATKQGGDWRGLASLCVENYELLSRCIREGAADEAAAGAQLFLVRYFRRIFELLDVSPTLLENEV